MTPASCQWEIDTKTTITLPRVPCLLSFAEIRFKYLDSVSCAAHCAGQAKHSWPEMAIWGPAPGQDGATWQKGGFGEYLGIWWEKRGQGKAGFSDPIGREPS